MWASSTRQMMAAAEPSLALLAAFAIAAIVGHVNSRDADGLEPVTP